MDILSLTKRLISIGSYVDRDNNEKGLGDFLFAYLSENLPWLKATKQPLENGRYNIVAAEDNPRLLFISHMDTVRPTGNISSRLTPVEKDGCLYGLGSCDMKAGLAASLSAVEKAGPGSGAGLIFDCDEEYYFLGARQLIKDFTFSPRLIVFPEPTDMNILSGCRGIIEARLDIAGRTSHAGRPDRGINAVTGAVAFASRLKQPLTRGDAAELGKTTVNLSAITGGLSQNGKIITQANAVPDLARIILDIRTADLDMDAGKARDLMLQTGKELSLGIENIKFNLDYRPFLSGKNDLSGLEDAAKASGRKPSYLDPADSGFFEAAFISRAWNCPAAAYGPGRTAHQADECVPVADLLSTVSVFSRLITIYAKS